MQRPFSSLSFVHPTNLPLLLASLQVVLLPSAHSVASAVGGSQQPQAPPSVCFSVDAGVFLPHIVSSTDTAQAEALSKDKSARVVVCTD